MATSEYALYSIHHAQQLRTEESLAQISSHMQSLGIATEILYVWYGAGKYDTVDSKVHRATSTDPLSKHPEADDVLQSLWPFMGESGIVVKYPTPADPHILAEALQKCLTGVKCAVVPQHTTSKPIAVADRTITVTKVYIETAE